MTATCQEIGDFVLQIEMPFLEHPGLMLTLQQARRYFDLDTAVCKAILEALTEARVLRKTPDGAYTRYLPRRQDGSPAAA